MCTVLWELAFWVGMWMELYPKCSQHWLNNSDPVVEHLKDQSRCTNFVFYFARCSRGFWYFEDGLIGKLLRVLHESCFFFFCLFVGLQVTGASFMSLCTCDSKWLVEAIIGKHAFFFSCFFAQLHFLSIHYVWLANVMLERKKKFCNAELFLFSLVYCSQGFHLMEGIPYLLDYNVQLIFEKARKKSAKIFFTGQAPCGCHYCSRTVTSAVSTRTQF